ncbi:MAG: hypothetical protein M3O70_07375, partial [Actinomycetota bacterium]|nr:hypothetical protein [Actinomycetota bacterium]
GTSNGCEARRASCSASPKPPSNPDETVRRALYRWWARRPCGSWCGGESERERLPSRVRTVLRSSYSSHYRRLLPPLLAALDVGSNNTAHRPLVDALALLRRYATRPGTVRFYHTDETVPLRRVVAAEWRARSVMSPPGVRESERDSHQLRQHRQSGHSGLG